MKLLIINPGSTSTKVSLFEDERELFSDSVFHDAPELLAFPTVNDQLSFRTEVVRSLLRSNGYDTADVDVFVGRGGSAQTQRAGVTEIDRLLYDDTVNAVGGSEHAAKLGVMIAYTLSLQTGKPAYTMDPTNVDELCDYARLTGIAGVYRNAQSHVLNQKGVARLYAAGLGRKYEDLNLIVCHVDGGITVSAHEHGRMIDGNVGSGGDGSFTPTRLGSVPVLPLLDYIEAHSVAEVRLMCSRSGGLVSWFGTSDAEKIRARIAEGDRKAKLVWETMLYQICKEVGAMSAVLSGRVDAILLTGGFARYEDVVETVRSRCGWIAPIAVYPGEVEQETLARGVLRVLRGEEKANRYTGKPVFTGFDF